MRYKRGASATIEGTGPEAAFRLFLLTYPTSTGLLAGNRYSLKAVLVTGDQCTVIGTQTIYDHQPGKNAGLQLLSVQISAVVSAVKRSGLKYIIRPMIALAVKSRAILLFYARLIIGWLIRSAKIPVSKIAPRQNQKNYVVRLGL